MGQISYEVKMGAAWNIITMEITFVLQFKWMSPAPHTIFVIVGDEFRLEKHPLVLSRGLKQPSEGRGEI